METRAERRAREQAQALQSLIIKRVVWTLILFALVIGTMWGMFRKLDDLCGRMTANVAAQNSCVEAQR